MAKNAANSPADWQSQLIQALLSLLDAAPSSKEPLASDPLRRAELLTNQAASRAAATAGAMALPSGPFAMILLIPEIIQLARIQRQLIADIAAAYGRTASLGPETMLWCMFKHMGAAWVRSVVVKHGAKYVVRKASTGVLRQLLERIGLQLGRRLIGKLAGRWIPVVSAAIAAGFAYRDTKSVGKAAIELFSASIEVSDEPAAVPDQAAPNTAQTLTGAAQAHNGLWVYADLRNGGQLVAGGRGHGAWSDRTWEQFQLVDAGDGKVAFRAISGSFVRLDPERNQRAYADAPSRESASLFRIIDCEDQQVALLHEATGVFVSVTSAGQPTLFAGSGSIGSTERFRFTVIAG